MSQKTNTKPIETLRDGAIKASIWKNQGENGAFYSVRVTRTFTDEQGNYRDSDSFTGTEIIRAGWLQLKAYDRTVALRAEENARRSS